MNFYKNFTELSPGEIAGAVTSALVVLVGSILTYKTKRMESGQKSEEGEIKVLLGHIKQLENLWKYSLEETQKLKKEFKKVLKEKNELQEENAELRASVTILNSEKDALREELEKIKAEF